MRMFRYGRLAAVSGVLALACAGPADVRSGSSGRIGLASPPAVSVGGTDTRPEYAFGQVTGGLLLSEDRGFLILDTRERQLRWYDADGAYATSFGRAGTGPGEFRLPAFLAPAAGDSVHVWDLQLRRETTISLRDGGSRSRDFGDALARLGQPLANLQGILGDGTMLIRRVAQPPTDRIEDGIHRFSSELVSLEPSAAEPSRPLAVLAGDEEYYLGIDGRFNSVPVIWGVKSLVAARGDRIAVGSTDRLELVLLDAGGDTVAAMSGHAEGRAVEEEEIDSLRQEALAAMDAPGYRNLPPAAIQGFVEPRKERIRRAPARSVTPVFDVLRIDSDGRTWVRRVGERRAAVWDWLVYDREGGPLGTVGIPSDLAFLDARSDRLLTVRLDSLDVPLVQVHRILWPGRMPDDTTIR